LVDFKIVCDEVSFPCHKNILASRSDVFSAMFKMANSVENKSGAVDIKDISAKTMKALLKFIYQAEASESDLDFDLLIAADKYNILDLVIQCEDQILSGLTEISASNILALSTTCPTNRIRDEVKNYIRQNCTREFYKNGVDWAKLKTSNPPLSTELLEDLIGAESMTIFLDH
jgi:speckle-type POZ protein